jgi:hypothetical protein
MSDFLGLWSDGRAAEKIHEQFLAWKFPENLRQKMLPRGGIAHIFPTSQSLTVFKKPWFYRMRG